MSSSASLSSLSSFGSEASLRSESSKASRRVCKTRDIFLWICLPLFLITNILFITHYHQQQSVPNESIQIKYIDNNFAVNTQTTLPPPPSYSPPPRSSSSFSGSSLYTSSASSLSSGTSLSSPPSEPVTKDFYVISHEILTEYDATAILYRHKITGLELLSILWNNNDDNHYSSKANSDKSGFSSEERVFGISFRTPPPSSSNGLPHILEHSVLCGSKNFPAKDPFLHLLKSSLQTYLNAMTFPDRTVYAVASTHSQDFYNLMNVYLDAVFQPLCVQDDGMILMQEGWHFQTSSHFSSHQSDANDNNRNESQHEALEYSGIVYNEMKGVYSSPDALLQRLSQSAIFPDNSYGFDAGGDPKEIPNLTYDEFKSYHKQYYHPSNARLFVSGLEDENEEDFWNMVNQYLETLEPTEFPTSSSEIEYQAKSFSSPQMKRFPYPVSPSPLLKSSTNQNEKDDDDTLEYDDNAENLSTKTPDPHLMLTTWLINDQKMLSPLQELIWTVLNHLLLGTPSSILHKTLMESGYGGAIADGTGVEIGLLQATFSVGMKDVNQKDDVQMIESLILQTLNQIVKDGFSNSDIAASMNTIEFQLREFDTNSKGISFLLAANTRWIYDESPIDGIKYEETLKELKSIIENSKSKVFKSFIQEYLLNNMHRVTIELYPSAFMETNMIEEESLRISSIQKEHSPEQYESILNATSQLKLRQEMDDSPEVVASIPTLSLADIKNTETKEYPIHIVEAPGGMNIITHELETSTSEILYVDLGVDLSGVSYEDIPLLPLFGRMITELGTDSITDVQLMRLIGTFTGGIDSKLYIDTTYVGEEENTSMTILNDDYLVTKLFLRGKATVSNMEHLYSILITMLTKTDFDNQEKVYEMIKETCTIMSSQIQSSGQIFANTRIRSRSSVVGYLDEILTGVTHLEWSRDLLSQIESDWSFVLQRLENMRKIILDEVRMREGMILNLTGDKDVIATAIASVSYFMEDFFSKSSPRKTKMKKKIEIHPWVSSVRSDMDHAGLLNSGFVVPTQVSYVGKGCPLYKSSEVMHGSVSVISHYLNTGYLWDQVRVLGGAYGAFSSLSRSEGILSFVSYRDPHLEETLDVYDKISEHLSTKAMQELNDENTRLLELQIIGTIGNLDGGVLKPADQGWVSMARWLRRESVVARRQWRNDIMNTSIEHVNLFRERMEMVWEDHAYTAVVSSQKKLEDVSDSHDIELLHPL